MGTTAISHWIFLVFTAFRRKEQALSLRWWGTLSGCHPLCPPHCTPPMATTDGALAPQRCPSEQPPKAALGESEAPSLQCKKPDIRRAFCNKKEEKNEKDLKQAMSGSPAEESDGDRGESSSLGSYEPSYGDIVCCKYEERKCTNIKFVLSCFFLFQKADKIVVFRRRL